MEKRWRSLVLPIPSLVLRFVPGSKSPANNNSRAELRGSLHPERKAVKKRGIRDEESIVVSSSLTPSVFTMSNWLHSGGTQKGRRGIFAEVIYGCGCSFVAQQWSNTSSGVQNSPLLPSYSIFCERRQQQQPPPPASLVFQGNRANVTFSA